MDSKQAALSGLETYRNNTINILQNLPLDAIAEMAEILHRARIDERTIYIMGNGGSGSTASHIECDLNKGARNDNHRRFRVMSLTDNMPTLMAYANDDAYASIFVEPLKNFFKPNEVVIGISGSGNSENVVNALRYARDNGGKTIAMVGYDGGKLKEVADLVVHIDVNDMQITEDLHLMVGHMLLRLFCSTPEFSAPTTPYPQ